MNQADMNKTAVDQNFQHDLSAGIDGELSREELRFLLRRLDHDASLQQAWTRYHVARDSLRRELPALASSDFAGRVMLAVSQQAVVPSATRRGQWMRWSAGGAIAASVAAAALMIGQPTGDVDRSVLPSAHRTVAALDATAPSTQALMPAAVPPWLSGNSAGLLSQRASATRGAPLNSNPSNYARSLSAFPSMRGYRTLDNKDGSYLLLLGPVQQVAPDGARQVRATAQ